MSMHQKSPAETYRNEAIENAPPIKIVRMLYQGALRFLDNAARENPRDPSSKFVYWLGRADAVVTELRLAIDHGVASELTPDLERLYLFCEDEIGRAGLERATDRIPGVRRVLEILLDAWKQVDLQDERAA